jgi:DNA polymerase-3 subunit epsilon
MYSIIDIETTGGKADGEKITEIAVFVHDGKKVVREFCTLLNPERHIPSFITRLTGIDDDMVSDAPKFYEVAKQIVEMTEGTVFVAHNAGFDYGFVRQEFKSLGYNYIRDYLCTVKASRKIIPGYRSYSLGTLCSQLGIKIDGRHRAGGDAYATVKLFELLLQKDVNNLLTKFVKNDYVHLRFPEGFDTKILDRIPEETGVYYLHNRDGSVIYIGKSNNIRKRILSHFANKNTRKALEMRNNICDITFELTGNDLIALLLESEEVKKYLPPFNRQLRNTFFSYGIFVSKNDDGYIMMKPKKISEGMQPVMACRSKEEAENILNRKVSRYNLCQKLCGLYEIKYACFQHSIGQCNGACIGKESVEEYNARAEKAIESFQLPHDNMLIIGKGRSAEENTVAMIEHGKYVGYGFFNPEFLGQHPEELKEVVKPKQHNRDVSRIIRQHLFSDHSDKVLMY